MFGISTNLQVNSVKIDILILSVQNYTHDFFQDPFKILLLTFYSYTGNNIFHIFYLVPC